MSSSVHVKAAPAAEAVVELVGVDVGLADGDFEPVGVAVGDFVAVGEGLAVEFVTISTLPATGHDAPATIVALRLALGDADGVVVGDDDADATATGSASCSPGADVPAITKPNMVSTPAPAIAIFAAFGDPSRAQDALRKTKA